MVLKGLIADEKALALLESLVNTCQADTDALANLKEDMIKKRMNTKLSKNMILRGMQNYAKYGAHSPYTNVLSNDQINATASKELLQLTTSFPVETARRLGRWRNLTAEPDCAATPDQIFKVRSLLRRTEGDSDSLVPEIFQGRNVSWLLIFTAWIYRRSPGHRFVQLAHRPPDHGFPFDRC